MALTPELLYTEFGVHYVPYKGPTQPFLLKESPGKGYGLFAQNPITANTEIGVYTGIIRELSLWNPRINPYCLLYPLRHGLYRVVIDALRYGSLMRFLNHSDEPNVGVDWEGGVPHIYTIRNVALGEELLISYGKYHFL